MNITPWTYPLFKHMLDEHGLTLLELELLEIMVICRGVERKTVVELLLQACLGKDQVENS